MGEGLRGWGNVLPLVFKNLSPPLELKIWELQKNEARRKKSYFDNLSLIFVIFIEGLKSSFG